MALSAPTLSLKHTLIYTLSFATFALALPNVHAQEEFIDFNKYQNEERQWANLKTKTLKVGDVIWTYSEAGSPNKPTLLLIHGIGANRDSWNQIARALSLDYHLIIPDLPGSGDTKVTDNFDLSLQNLTDQLRRFVEASHIQNQLHLAGHSVGGSIALMYASQYHYDTKSLFILGAGGILKNNQTNYLNNPIYLKQLLIQQPGDLDFVSRKVMYNPPFVPSIIKKQYEQHLIKNAQHTARLINQLTDMNKQYSLSSFKEMLGHITAPTLILWGKQDQIVNVEIAQELKNSIKNAQQPIILNHVGHIPMLEAPERVSQSYVAFLNTVQ